MQMTFPQRPLALLGAFLLFSQTAGACINDRDSDTLAKQAKGLPDTVSVITGRFPRNPALFYEMRIQRVAKELASHPERLQLYDDIAAAYDRLGKDDDAIAWIEKKHRHLGKTSPSNPQFHEDWYRYFANVGTFRAHRWIRAGADSKQMEKLRQARAEIAKAIQIKPDAHFGREQYQLAVMDWLLDHRDLRLAEYIRTNSKRLSTGSVLNGSSLLPDGTEGLSGLVVLGGAWESPDIFATLAGQMFRTRRTKVAYLAQFRCQELLDSGKKSLQNSSGSINSAIDLIDNKPSPSNRETLKEAYPKLRTEAETWQNARWKYMLVRLHQGKHPDIDPTFWKDWKETPAPDLSEYAPQTLGWLLAPRYPVLSFLIAGFAIAAFCFSVRGLRRYLRNRG